MEFKDYLAALRRHWPSWVVTTVLGLLIAAQFLHLSTPTYEARAQVFVASSSTGTSQFVSQRVKSYPDVAVSRAVLGPVMDRLNLDAPFAEVRQHVTASNPVDTSQILITATSEYPAQAADLANAVAEEFTKVVEELERTDSGPSPVSLTVTDPAIEPTSPSGASSLYVLTLGFVVGLLLGMALAIVRSRMSTALYDEPAIRAAWGEDESVHVLTAPSGRARRSPLAGRPASALARRLELMAEERPVRVLLLSPTPAPTARRAVLEFATEVVDELKVRGVLAATAGYDPETTDPDADTDARVRIDVGNPMAPLRVWRRVAQDCDGVVLVVRSGRVVAADLHELRSVLRTVAIRPLAVVLASRQRGRWAPAVTPMSAAQVLLLRASSRSAAPDPQNTTGLAPTVGRMGTPPVPPAGKASTATAVRARPFIGTDDGSGKPAR
jgi:capsular polysaccharide biosynthesis protein